MLILNGWNLLLMNWTSVRVKYGEFYHLEGERLITEATLIALCYEMKPNKCKSSIWGKSKQGYINWFGTIHYPISNTAPFTYYELLVPGLTDRHHVILKDLGYMTKVYPTFSKDNRRKHYSKITKPKKV